VLTRRWRFGARPRSTSSRATGTWPFWPGAGGRPLSGSPASVMAIRRLGARAPVLAQAVNQEGIIAFFMGHLVFHASFSSRAWLQTVFGPPTVPLLSAQYPAAKEPGVSALEIGCATRIPGQRAPSDVWALPGPLPRALPRWPAWAVLPEDAHLRPWALPRAVATIMPRRSIRRHSPPTLNQPSVHRLAGWPAVRLARARGGAASSAVHFSLSLLRSGAFPVRILVSFTSGPGAIVGRLNPSAFWARSFAEVPFSRTLRWRPASKIWFAYVVAAWRVSTPGPPQGLCGRAQSSERV